MEQIHNSVLHALIYQLNRTIMNFVLPSGVSPKIMLDEKAIEQQAILFSHTIRFYSTRSDVMVVFSQRRHLRQILQLGTTRFNLSIKSDFLEFQSCREMLNTEDHS